MKDINAVNSSVDLLYAFRSFTLDTIMSFTFGKNIDALHAPAFADPLILAMDASLRMLPFLKNFPNIRKMIFGVPPSLVMKIVPDSEKLAPRLYQVRDIVQKQLQAVLNSPEKLDEAPVQTIFHRMLDAQAYRTKTVPDLTALHDEGFTLIFAGANTVADTMLELYPSGVREPSNTRLGLRVDDLPVRLGQALAAGGSTATRDGLPDPERAFVVDPDGNTVELSSAPGSLADEILALEMKLLTRNVRASRVELEQLLADDFSEFGSSGREYSKLEVIETLVANPELAPEMLAMSEFRTLPLAANVVLATYSYRQSRRSSLWRKDTSGWRLVFHQAGPR